MIEIENALTYRAFGLTIVSDVVLPELEQVQNEILEQKATLDVSIVKVDMTRNWNLLGVEEGKSFFVQKQFCMFEVPGVAIFKVEAGKYITVSPFEGSAEDKVRLFLLGTCMGIILFQRGVLPIHGSAIKIDGKVFAIVGDSGAGKSTLARSFIERGFQLLTDDVIAVSLTEDGVPVVTPSYPHQKLWQESLDQFGIESSQFRPIYDRKTKFAIPLDDQFNRNVLPLAGIVELFKSNKDEIEMEEIPGLERFYTIYRNTYRNFIMRGSGLMDWHFEFSSKIMRHLEFYRIFRPKNRFTANELVDLILSKVKER